MITCNGFREQFFQARMSQIKFSILCEVHPSRVSKILNGDVMSTNELDKFCKALNCQPGDLIEWEVER